MLYRKILAVILMGGALLFLTADDIGIDTIISPGATHPLNTPITVIARVRRYSGGGTPSFPVVCSIVSSNGYLRYTNTQTVLLPEPLDTARVSFANYTPTFSEVESVILRTLLANDTNPANDRMSRACAIYQYYQDFEANNGGYVPNPDTSWQWGQPIPPPNPHSGTNLWGTTLAGNYPNGDNAKLTTSEFIVTNNNPVLIFWHWYYTEPAWDGGNVKISTNSGYTWSLVHPVGGYPYYCYPSPMESCYSSICTTWTEAVFNLPLVSGQQFLIRWHFWSDGSVSYRGWFIDDVSLIGATPTAIAEDEPNYLSFTTLNAPKPNPVINGLAHISFTLAEPSQISLKIFDASGRLIKTLVDTHLKQGIYNYFWNCRDGYNRQVAEGIYFATLETPKQKFTNKLVLFERE